MRLYEVDREALMRRLTHCFAYQLLVKGFCLGKTASSLVPFSLFLIELIFQ